MTNKLKRIFAIVLICTLMIGCSSRAAMNAEAKSVNKFTLRVGQKDTLRITNCKKKTKWKITSGKRVIKIVKRKKTSIVIKARRKGVARITVKAGKQRWYAKIVVKAKKTSKKKTSAGRTSTKKTPTTKKNTSTASTVETKIKNSISLKVSRLKDGNILFAIYNGSNYFIPSMDVTCNIYDDRGRLLNDITINAKYLGAKRTWYTATCEGPFDLTDYNRESLVPSKTKITKITLDLDDDCTSMAKYVSGKISFVRDNGNLEMESTFTNSSTSKTAQCYWTVLYKDANGNVVAIHESYLPERINPNDSETIVRDAPENYYTDDQIDFKSGTVYWYAGHE